MTGSRKMGTPKVMRGRKKQVFQPVATWRYQVIGLVFALMFVSLGARAVFLQVIDAEYLQTQGSARYLREEKDPPTRGMVLDRNSEPLAISTPVESIWVHPPTILEQQNKYSYKQLTSLLGISRDEFLHKVKKNGKRQFLYIKRQLSPAQAQKILDLNVPGVDSKREYRRYYPSGRVFGHVLGFTNIDNIGQEGVELAYDKQLKGQAGLSQVMKDKYGHVIEYVEQLSQVEHGENIKLSIDSRIQYLAYRYLLAAVKKHKAASASLVALDAKTGEILAMVSAPDFNPNNRAELKSARFRNRSITDAFEPGSTMKPLTVALALERGMVSPGLQIDTSPGYFDIGRSRISDTSNHGVLTVSDVIRQSSNIGAAKVAMMMEPIELYKFYKSLGFGSTNKLKLQGETKGLLIKRKWRPIEHATLSYGYGLSINALQLARAYQALANDGVLLPVSLEVVDKVPEGKQVFSKKTARQVTAMLELAASRKGTAPKAMVANYRVAGKTGTTHRLQDGSYMEDSYSSLFAGFAPASNPDIVMAILVTDPRGAEYYGGLVAAPVFSKVMEGALRYRNVAPDGVELEKDKPKLMISLPASKVATASEKNSSEGE